jgi:hypothetical protein
MISIKRRTFLQASTSLSFFPPLLAQTTAQAPAKASELRCDVAVIGGGTGGFAAALAALRNGAKVVLTEETDWIGGQLTAQAVPPDEHPWIEQFGCTRSYREYRNAVRNYYRDRYPLTEAARTRIDLNPGNGSVSRLTHEFRVSVAVLEAMLLPYIGSGQLTLLLQHSPESATVDGDRVTSVTVLDGRLGSRRTITAQYFLDATELGDLLPLTKTEFATGAEPQSQTGEMHAPSQAEPANSQSFTYCFAIEYAPGEDQTIDKPDEYNFWRDYAPKLSPPWTGKLLSWSMCEPKTLARRDAYFDPRPDATAQSGLNLWVYRRIADPANFVSGAYPNGMTLVNWPQNDFWLGDLVTANREERKTLLRRAKQLSLSLLYWMQSEAPGPTSAAGWKGLKLRRDITGTEDGLAKTVYVREARRIQAEFTILEQHVGTQMRTAANASSSAEIYAETLPDTVGIGCYRIDLHPSAGGTNYIDVSSLPFQIPLGALIPKRVENLLPACKNIGTTHITNGCYRLHPVEWNIGEAAGALAAHALKSKQTPRAIRNDKRLLQDFQRSLQAQGFELAWPRIHPV